jgi:hypothetical protein
MLGRDANEEPVSLLRHPATTGEQPVRSLVAVPLSSQEVLDAGP